MKTFTLIFASLFLVASFSSLGLAADRGTDNEEQFDWSVGITEWFSGADAGWQTSFPTVDTSTNTPGRAESELSFKHINSPITILRGRAALNPDWSLAVAYGFGSISGGRGTDTDRFLPDTGGVNVFSESTNDISGDVRLVEADVRYRKKTAENQRSPWGFLVGYFHYEDNLKMTNGVQVISGTFNGMTFPPPGPFPGLNSTFDFSWDALKLGGLYEGRLAKSLLFTGILAVYPYVSYDGEGYWNLRTGTAPTDFRLQSPSFVQKSTSGFGYDATLGFAYRITDQAEFSAGYRYLYLKAKNGMDTAFFADGSIGQANLDWAKVTRQGAYVGFSYKF